jgi:hypothetical protein
MNQIPRLTILGQEVDRVGLLEDCTPLLDDAAALRRQIKTSGYIYLPGYLGRDRVINARRSFIEALLERGVIDTDHDPMEAVFKLGTGVNPDVTRPGPGVTHGRLETMFKNWQPVHDLLYDGPMIKLFRTLLGGDVLHFDFTWTRQVYPGPASPMHSDVVYMGRGTHELYTAWTPLGDNDFEMGGLILLEGSNQHEGLAKSYWKSDVDAYCVNKPTARAWGKSWGTSGGLWCSPSRLRRSLGAERWLTADYRMGDLLIFDIFTVHGGSDNHSNKIRLSTDTRYQRADQPADHRWIGAEPVAHGPGGKKGMVC